MAWQRTKTQPRHVHQYRRIRLGTQGVPVMACSLPDCYHYVPIDLAIGKASRCYRCGLVFVLTKYMIRRLVKPHCNRCFKGQTDAIQVLQDLASLRLQRRQASEHADRAPRRGDVSAVSGLSSP